MALTHLKESNRAQQEEWQGYTDDGNNPRGWE